MVLRTLLVTLALAASGAALAVAPAVAKAPPKGKYWCRYYEDNSQMGFLSFLSAKTYQFNRTKKGTYRTAGQKIVFRTGNFKGLYKHAKWARKSGKYVIYLYDKSSFGHSNLDVWCTKIPKK